MFYCNKILLYMYWIIRTYFEHSIFSIFCLFFYVKNFSLSVTLFLSSIFEFCMKFKVQLSLSYIVSKNFIWSQNIRAVSPSSTKRLFLTKPPPPWLITSFMNGPLCSFQVNKQDHVWCDQCNERGGRLKH